ncbi:phosphate regulon sensor histidine kinase PhoR, partial [Rhizobium ruizarguesonis]
LGHVRYALLPLARDVGVDINLHLPYGKVEVLGDRDELVQVFENLMENACKYGQEGSRSECSIWLGALVAMVSRTMSSTPGER